MTPLDLEFVRQQFPAFSEPSLDDFAFFENAGGSYACAPVIDRLERYYRQTKVQPYYAFDPSIRAGQHMDAARQRLAAWMNVATEEVHFGPSTTQNVYVIAQALRQHLHRGDEVVVTNQDHEANIGAWRRLEADGIVVREWTVDPDTGELNPDDLDAWLGPKTRAVAFTQCSNLVASINPVRDITDRIHAAGAIAIVDAVSYCPHGLPDLGALGADIYLYSLYKVYGPHLGVMYMTDELNQELPNQGHFFNRDKPTSRFTPAGPDHAQIAATQGVLDYFDRVHTHHFGDRGTEVEKAGRLHDLFRAYETQQVQPLLDYLAHHPRVRLIGKPQADLRAPTVGFTIDGAEPADVAAELGKRGLGVGVGDFYAYRLVKALGIDPKQGALRVSMVHYTHPQEVERLLTALDDLI